MWVKEIQEFCPDKPFILVGLKSDLRDEFESKADELRAKQMEPVPRAKGEEMQKKIHACAYIECSALKAKNLTEVFDTAVKYAINPPQAQPQQQQQSSGGCCEVF